MNKNLLVSILVLALVGFGAYLMIKNAPDKEVLNQEVINPNQEVSENMNEESNIDMNSAPQMTILREGAGEAASKAGDTLGVVYVGSFEDGQVFDSNVSSGQNFEFTLGAGQVISGWEIGLMGMKVGEVRRLVLPPAFAYGENAVGPIPANSTLIFEVELKEIK
jgi:FKBP-type peptidyl-prolyl cis-trans isomerase